MIELHFNALLFLVTIKLLTLRRPLLPYGYSYKASCTSLS